MSACIADRLAMVSSRLSPLAVDERAMSRLITSADRRLAAISKVVRVRVLFSKNRLNTLLPRSSGTFFTSRSLTPTKVCAVSRIWVRMSRGRPSMDSRCTSSPCLFSWGLLWVSMGSRLDAEAEAARVVARELEGLRGRQAHARRGEVRLDRQFAPAAIHQHRQRDAGRSPIVEQLIDHGADGATGVEHVVEED